MADSLDVLESPLPRLDAITCLPTVMGLPNTASMGGITSIVQRDADTRPVRLRRDTRPALIAVAADSSVENWTSAMVELVRGTESIRILTISPQAAKR